jgi:hypothetical protein
MDEIFYILFLVGWLAFSIYQQNQKKKRKEAARNLANAAAGKGENEIHSQEDTEPYKVTPVEKVSSKPDFRKALEEILLGEQLNLETIPGDDAQSFEAIPEKEYPKENKYQKYSHELPDNSKEELEKEMVLQVEDTDQELTEHYFNLRNAVIYAEILKPKYVN